MAVVFLLQNHSFFASEEMKRFASLEKMGQEKRLLLNCIAGNIFPDEGSICFDDKDLLVNCEMRKEFGILIQPSF